MQIQKLRPEELTKLVGKPGTLYYTDIDGVVTHYLWNAGAFNPAAGFTTAQVPALRAVVSGYGNCVAGIGNSILRAQGAAKDTASFLEYAAITSGGGMKVVKNAGINGNKTADILARISTDVLAEPARYIAVMEAANDAMNSVTVAQHRTNMTAIILAARAAGRVPFVIGSPPVNTYNIWRYNAADQALCASLGVEYVNPWTACVADGAWIDSSYSYDGVHPTPKASRIAGVRLWALVSRLFSGSPDLTWANVDADGMLTTNGLFGTNVAGVPTGWTGATTGIAHSIEAGTGEVMGNWWKMTLTGITGWKVNSRTGIALPSGWVSGDRVRMSCRIRTTGFEANGGAANGSYPMQGKLGVYISLNWGGVSDTLVLREVDGDIEGVCSVDGLIPVGTSGTSTLQIVATQTATVSGEVSVAQLQVHNLSAIARL